MVRITKECTPAGHKMLSNTTDFKLPLLPREVRVWGGEGGDSLKKFTEMLVKKMKKKKKLLRHSKITYCRGDF